MPGSLRRSGMSDTDASSADPFGQIADELVEPFHCQQADASSCW
jgi:hypothetical protein